MEKIDPLSGMPDGIAEGIDIKPDFEDQHDPKPDIFDVLAEWLDNVLKKLT